MEERTEQQMREYLDNQHVPDPEQVYHYGEIWNWFRLQELGLPIPEPLSEEAKQAYVDEHLQTCSNCGHTREWHNVAARDHQFEG